MEIDQTINHDSLLKGLRELVDRKTDEQNGNNGKICQFWKNAAKDTSASIANGTYVSLNDIGEIVPFPEEVVCSEHDSVNCLCWL